MKQRTEHSKELLAVLSGIQREKLNPKDQVSYDLLRFETELAIDEYFSRLWTLPVNQRDGIQLIDDLASALRFETVKDYEDWIARLRALPLQIDQTIALMRIGIAEKRTHARQVMESVPGQIKKQIVESPEESAFYLPFKKWPAAIGEADRTRLGAGAKSAIKEHVVPAYRRFDEFFEREYQPACTELPGAWQWPDGESVYAFAARKFTTTRMTPREIHELGLREVERITAGMDRIIGQVGWKGSRIEFFEHLRSDKRFYCKTQEELLEAYRATSKRIDPTLVKVFKTLPRTPYGVEAIPANVAPNTTAPWLPTVPVPAPSL